MDDAVVGRWRHPKIWELALQTALGAAGKTLQFVTNTGTTLQFVNIARMACRSG